MSVLVDSSLWIDYFRGSENPTHLDYLIAENLVVINDLVLAELIPSLKLRRQLKLICLMQLLPRPDLSIEWDNLIKMQVLCLRRGINKVGIPDLIIAQHAIQNDLELYSLDKHFKLLANHFPLRLYLRS